MTAVQCHFNCLQNTIEQRRLAVDLAEVIIKWEFQRLREMQEGEVIQLCHLMNHSLICKPYTGGRHRAGWWIEGHTGVCGCGCMCVVCVGVV